MSSFRSLSVPELGSSCAIGWLSQYHYFHNRPTPVGRTSTIRLMKQAYAVVEPQSTFGGGERKIPAYCVQRSVFMRSCSVMISKRGADVARQYLPPSRINCGTALFQTTISCVTCTSRTCFIKLSSCSIDGCVQLIDRLDSRQRHSSLTVILAFKRLCP